MSFNREIEVAFKADEGVLRMAAAAGDVDAQFEVLKIDEERRLSAEEKPQEISQAEYRSAVSAE